MQEKEIYNFWKWFYANQTDLQSDSYDQSLLKRLDDTISNWNLTWEIGPGKSKDNSLTISPNGDVDLLELTENIISSAPTIDTWEFYATKQPKENWHLLKLINENINIDAGNWEYILLQYNDGKIEILIKADNLSEYNQDTKELIANLILTNLLGED